MRISFWQYFCNWLWQQVKAEQIGTPIAWTKKILSHAHTITFWQYFYNWLWRQVKVEQMGTSIALTKKILSHAYTLLAVLLWLVTVANKAEQMRTLIVWTKIYIGAYFFLSFNLLYHCICIKLKLICWFKILQTTPSMSSIYPCVHMQACTRTCTQIPAGHYFSYILCSSTLGNTKTRSEVLD